MPCTGENEEDTLERKEGKLCYQNCFLHFEYI